MSSTPPRVYDVIAFGDEVPGILALVAAVREYRRRTGQRLKTLLMFPGFSQHGIGGHLVRGGLAYLDRCQVPLAVRQSLGLPTFGDPPKLYQEFLQRSGVAQIALDPHKADRTLRQMLSETGTDILSRVAIESVIKEQSVIRGLRLKRGDTYIAKQFIDATVNAQLAQAAGVEKIQGFGTFGLPESELPVTLVFVTEGLSVHRLKDIEMTYLRRFVNLGDREAQNILNTVAGSPQRAELLRRTMSDAHGKLRGLYAGQDYIDVRSLALSVAYHFFRGKKFSLIDSQSILDQANIAILPGDRLSWNALLFRVTGSQAEALARGAARPTTAMLEEMNYLEKWFKSLGATGVKPAVELYIRHAGNITGVVSPLSGAQMLEGGVPNHQALGTFGYHLDVRGGIEGLGVKASQLGLGSINFHEPPLFNIGIQHSLVKAVPNLAVISPASGFRGYACSAGRIVEFNAGVGQGVGIAAAIAIANRRNLAQIGNAEVRQVLIQTQQLPRVYGRANASEASRLFAFENRLGSDIAIA